MSMGTSTTSPSDNNALVSTLDSKLTIPSIASATPLSDLPANTWAYNVPSLPEHGTNYHPLPNPQGRTAAEKQHTIKEDGHMGTESTTVNFATKVNTEQASGTYNNTVLYTATANNPPVPQAKAILGSNGNLNFVYDINTYNVDDYYDDNISHTQIKAVYNVPYKSTGASNVPWAGGKGSSSDPNYYRPDITSVNFTQNFHNYPVASTAYWFQNDRYISNVTNIANLNPTAEENVSMASMFNLTSYEIAGDLSLDLADLDTHKASSMSDMFRNFGGKSATVTIDLSNWKVGQVRNMGSMFTHYQATFLNTRWSIGDIGKWDVQNVTNMREMFYCYQSSNANKPEWFIGDIGKWNTSSVKDMHWMFYGIGGSTDSNWALDLSNWDTSSVTKMDGMFWDIGGTSTFGRIGNIGNWNTSNVTDMTYMFRNSARGQLDLSRWDTHKVKSMLAMFGYSGSTASLIDISGWDTSEVTSMDEMFYNMYSLKEVYVGAGWNTDKVMSSANMFTNDRSLVGGKGTTYSTSHINHEYARLDNPPDYPGYFTNKNDPGPPPSPTPTPSDDSNGGSGGNVALTFLSNPNNNSTTTTSSDMSSTNGYSNPQGALSSKHVIPGTSSPNWFLFILLLTLSILTLGISLFIFYRKSKQEKEVQIG